MTNFVIHEFLWFKDADAGVRGSDKIWGWVEVEGRFYNFWGRRPADGEEKKTLTFKYNGGWKPSQALSTRAEEKQRKGYKTISCKHNGQEYPEIERIYPNFVKSFQNQLMLAKLCDRIKGMYGVD